MADNDITPALPDKVAGPKKALVGDEAVQAEVHTVEPEVTVDKSTQKYAPEATQQAVYPVHEVSIALDTVITDPTDPRAVQVPDAGRTPDTGLPIHALANGTPEDQFAADADKDPEEVDAGRGFPPVGTEARNEGTNPAGPAPTP